MPHPHSEPQAHRSLNAPLCQMLFLFQSDAIVICRRKRRFSGFVFASQVWFKSLSSSRLVVAAAAVRSNTVCDSDVTVSCSDVRVMSESWTVSKHTADISWSSDVERCVRRRVGRAITWTSAELSLASALPAWCRSTTARCCHAVYRPLTRTTGSTVHLGNRSD